MKLEDVIKMIVDQPIIFVGLVILIYWIVYKSFTTDPDDPKNSELEKEFDEFMKKTYHDIQDKKDEDK